MQFSYYNSHLLILLTISSLKNSSKLPSARQKAVGPAHSGTADTLASALCVEQKDRPEQVVPKTSHKRTDTNAHPIVYLALKTRGLYVSDSYQKTPPQSKMFSKKRRCAASVFPALFAAHV